MHTGRRLVFAARTRYSGHSHRAHRRLLPHNPQHTHLRLVSNRATDSDLGGATPVNVGDQFFNELCKREIGRKMCEAAGCTHFMPMDCDEFYKTDELTHVKKVMLDNDYEGAACKMRFFFKYPTQELLPTDDMNYVPIMYKIASLPPFPKLCEGETTMPFRLACPYPCLIDPTRKVLLCGLIQEAIYELINGLVHELMSNSSKGSVVSTYSRETR
jgi:hypothetical protein